MQNNKIISNNHQIIGLDIGRKNTKVYSEFNGEEYSAIFSSIIGDGRNINFDDYKDPIYIDVDGVDYFVGELAEKESYSPTRNSSDSKISLTAKILIHSAISKIAKCDRIRVVFGVPNNAYRKQVLLSIIEEYQGKTIKVKDKISNTSKTVLIEMVDIFREGDAVCYDVMRDRINVDKDVAFISIGFRTSEISYFEKGMNFIDRLSKTIPYGNQHILSYVQNKLKENNIVKELHDIDSNIRDYDKFKKEAYNLASESFTQKIETIIENGFVMTDVYVAGGTILHLSLDTRFNIVDNPIMSVSRGLAYVGTLIF